ncbi:MAG: hypothetical protein DME19_00830 [Verrucomicrobia bacterium]|nr:MAG: hypothetical protein DME19_00830 [Verrucomicrobiota bacterium]
MNWKELPLRPKPVNTHPPEIIELLLRCQDAANEVLEDVRALWQHETVRGARDPLGEFLESANRKNLWNGASYERFHLSRRLELVGAEAEWLLRRKRDDSDLPPPFWLRALPLCCRIAGEKALFPKGGGPVLRWLAFNMDVRDHGSKERIEKTINLNSSDSPVKLIRPCNPLIDVLFDYVKETPDAPLYSWWAIRFRTTGPENGLPGPWLDIRVSVNNRQGIGKEMPLVNAVTPPAGLRSDKERGKIMEMLRQWADFGKTDEIAGQSTRYIRNYCRTVERFYPNRRWPAAGVDALLCPGIVCPPDPAFGGTAATLFWGFEGSLSEVQARSLLLLSQILLAGIGQFPRVVEVQHQSILAGMERGAERTLHQLPKDIAALHRDFTDLKSDLDRLRRTNPGIPYFQVPDAIQVMMMFMKAQNSRQLWQLPEDLPLMLSRTWTPRSIARFVDRVVWPATITRILNDGKVQDLAEKGELSWASIQDLERRYPRPVLALEKPFKVRNPHRVYPLVLLALRQAFQHTYLHTLLSGANLHRDRGRPPRPGKVEIRHGCGRGQAEYIIITNTGPPPQGGETRPQPGWANDLTVFEGLTGNWKVTEVKPMQWSIYDDTKQSWSTELRYQPAHRKRNRAAAPPGDQLFPAHYLER